MRKAVYESSFKLADGTGLQLTVTIGVASGRGTSLDGNALFRAADEDLLATKAAGRNRVGPGRLL